MEVERKCRVRDGGWHGKGRRVLRCLGVEGEKLKLVMETHSA